ncbi:TIGR03943 family putative permease subunit [Paenibacillus rubinfantis]|uniref:TIGR03943 family putative permease subunit n=1 Tax=Paenibacillus rubinfantis TaxID=1720296 RepID=UPI00073E2C41|nr:TIGR03943 family protein [Paenibacillus rubinfantis]
MREQRSITALHHLVRAILLLGLSILIAYLVETNNLQLYIGVRIRPLVKISALIVYALAVIQGFIAYRIYRGSAVMDCDCCEPAPTKSWPKAGFLYGMIALPLLLGFLLPDTVLGGSFVDKKGIVFTSSIPYGSAGYSSQQAAAAEVADPPEEAVSGKETLSDSSEISPEKEAPSDESLDERFQADDDFTRDLAELAKRIYVLPVIEVKPEIYMEILSAIVSFKEPFLGKEMEISGFVYREPDLEENQWVIGRIAVQCCTADATPYGVLMEFDGTSQLKEDAWVKVKGTLGQTKYHGNPIIQLEAAEVEVIERPDNPYIYPNFDFLNVDIP